MAFHTRSLFPVLLQKERPRSLSVYVTTMDGVGEQPSMAVACPNSSMSSLYSQLIVKLAGSVIVGGVWSTTCMVWTQLLAFPQSSYTTQVLYKVPVPLHPLSPVVLSKCRRSMFSTDVQLSLITGDPNTDGSTDSPQLTSREPPQAI